MHTAAHLLAADILRQLDERTPVDVLGYEVVAVLGHGACGVVCRARDLSLRREVALKLIPVVGQPAAAEHAVSEACTTANVTHENVVVIHGYSHVERVGSYHCPLVFIVMELVRGDNLAVWVRRRRPHPADIVDVLLKAGRGLAAAHAVDVVHLDFKPENVVVDHDGRPRVVDFGLARWAAGAAAPRTGGTPGYMAPEVLRGRPDACSDQFAFAVTLWEMLADTRPFAAGADGKLRMGELQGAKRIPPPLRELLDAALQPDPQARHDDMNEMLQALAEARPRLRSRRRWPALAGATAATSLILLGAGQYTPAAEPPPVESSQRPHCPDAEPFLGSWELVTAVLWAENARFLGARGYYSLDITADDDCTPTVVMRKHGDTGKPDYRKIYQDRAIGTLTRKLSDAPALAFEVWLGPDKPLDGSAPARRGEWHYRFLLEGGETRTRGDWELVNDKTGGPTMRGVLGGGRDAVADDLPAITRDAACPSQCRLRCADATAARTCVDTACPQPGPLTTCRDVPAGFVAPTAAVSAAQLGPVPPAPASDNCVRVARQLPGRWRVHKRSERARQDTFVLDLQSAGCELSGTVRREDGAGSVHTITGAVDATGVWRLARKKAPDEPIWALVGWDPAFGAADRGAAGLIANKIP